MSSSNNKVGVLALQGNYAAHVKRLNELGVKNILVKKISDLTDIAGLIIPGGESTTLIKLMRPYAWKQALQDFIKNGKIIFGTCAGMILLAKKVSPHQTSFNLINVTVKRNAYGRQLDSHIAFSKNIDKSLGTDPIEMVFIRAPQIMNVTSPMKILVTHKDLPVLVEENNIMVAAFHPELSNDTRVHEYFLKKSGVR